MTYRPEFVKALNNNKRTEPHNLNGDAKIMSKTFEKIVKTIKGLKRPIKREYKAEIIGVFGSYARGEQKKSSDVDVLVRFLEGATLFDFVGLSNFLEEKLGIKVDVVSERAVRPELKKQILGEVVPI